MRFPLGSQNIAGASQFTDVLIRKFMWSGRPHCPGTGRQEKSSLWSLGANY